MRKVHILLFVVLLSLASCSPKVITNIQQTHPTLDYTEEVVVIPLSKSLPDGARIIGDIKIGDTGFSTNCTWDIIIETAKEEARKAGGNAIKITEHTPPSVFGSSCHRIKANIVRIDNPNDYKIEDEVPCINDDFAILNVYRYSGTGALVSYDLHLGDTTICRVKNKYKTSIKVEKKGLNTIWAKTEAKTELPIDIEMGHTYYIKCGIKMGIFVGQPTLQLIDYKTGKLEYESLKSKE